MALVVVVVASPFVARSLGPQDSVYVAASGVGDARGSECKGLRLSAAAAMGRESVRVLSNNTGG